MASKIVDLTARDVRYPTSLGLDGSDASHPDPDYSMVYIQLITDDPRVKGCGLTFTLGRGNELVLHAVDSLRFLVVGRHIEAIQNDMSKWVRELTSEGQMRWVGPEKGVLALAVGGIVNSFWDLWGKLEGKPVWKLLCDMTPEQIVTLVDFRYIDDCITKEEALSILKKGKRHQEEREKYVKKKGFPAYTTEVGWLGYEDDKIRALSKKYLEDGFTMFKMKVGSNIEDDKRRLGVIRECVGPKNKVATDANQKWSVHQAVDWMKELAKFDIYWIEEPTCADDVLGHKHIAEQLKPHGIRVATGEVCQNRVMFKQFLMSGAMGVCQIDSARMAGVNEVIAVYLMAAKLGVPVCPHAGGVGLCEMVQHLQVFDFVYLTGTFEDRMIEYVSHLHEVFKHPPKMGKSCYYPPEAPGYSTEAHEDNVRDHEYPHGRVWKDLFQSGRYSDPSLKHKRLN